MSIHIFTSNFEAEDALLYELEQIRPTSLANLGRKNIIVVPTKSLVRYIRDFCHRKELNIGFQVFTVSEFAVWILRQKGCEPAKTSKLFSLLLREKAEEQKHENFLKYILSLTENEDGSDGLARIESTISELFSAGFESDKIASYLNELDKDDWEMIAPIFQIASRLIEERKGIGEIGTSEALYWQVTEALESTGFPDSAQKIIFYGMQDSSAVVGSFLRAVHQAAGAENCLIFIHKALDPLFKYKADVSNKIVDSFLSERLRIPEKPQINKQETTFEQEISYVKVVGRQAELRHAIQTIVQVVEEDNAVSWEDCAIVARDLTPYIPFIRSEVGKMGIPISLETPLYVSTPSSKRVQGFLRLLRQRKHCDVYWFLNILHFQMETEANFYSTDDIQRYVREENCRTIQDLFAALDDSIKKSVLKAEARAKEGKEYSEPGHKLRTCNRIIETGTQKGQIINQKKKRALSLSMLKNIYARIEDLFVSLSELQRSSNLEAQTNVLLRILDTHLQWRVLWDTERMMIYSSLMRLQTEVLRRKVVWKDCLLLLNKDLAEVGKALLDQKGVGIRLFSALDAVGMCFSHVVLLGVNRDVFPQVQGEDPILNRKIRAQLQNSLQGLSLRERKLFSERHLLYWLIGSAQNVLISWLAVDDKGNEMGEAPLIRRLIAKETDHTSLIKHIPSCFSADQDILTSPIVEQVCLLGIRGDSTQYFQRLEHVLTWGTKGLGQKEELSREKIQGLSSTIQRSLNIQRSEAPELTVYDGLIGRSVNYPSLETELYVTRIEDVIKCPWQSFMVKVLGLPDRNNMEAYPSLQSNDIGSIVHGVLEDIINEQFTDEEQKYIKIEERFKRAIPERTIIWPESSVIITMLEKRINQQLEEAGVHFDGYREVLLEQSKALLQTARSKEFVNDRLVDCFGAEVDGQSRFSVQGIFGAAAVENISLSPEEPVADMDKILDGEAGIVQCQFKADRVDLHTAESGQKLLHLVDYKTGRPIDTKTKKASNDKSMRTYLKKGQKLQIPIYTSCYQGELNAHPTKGELFFLKPDIPQFFFGIDLEELQKEDADQNSILKDTGRIVASALAVRSLGTFFPTIGGESCSWCQLRSTCRLQDESFARKWEAVQEKLAVDAQTPEERIIQSILEIRGSK